jgi:oxalate---CoA ligase
LRAVAHQYIFGMLTVQPHGPFYLGGMCGGARIAEQMILELEAQGQRVDLVAIFDTWVLEHTMPPWLSSLNYYRQRLGTLRKASLPQQLQTLKVAVKSRIVGAVNKTPPQTPWREAFWPENFTPSCFRAPIALFKRPKQPIYYKDDPLLGLGSRAEGGVEVHEIGVGHFEHLQILREPYVHEVSVKLAQCMQRARNRAEWTTEH